MSAPVGLQVFVGFVMFALIFWPLERYFPARDKRLLRAGWLTDVAYYVAGCFVGRISDAASVGGMLLIRHATGVAPHTGAASQPGWIQVIELVLLADFLAYWFHRTIHRNRWLWRLHRVHHSSQAMDWLANVHLHPVDKFLGDCFQFVPIFLAGFADGPILAYTIFLGFQGFLNHSNVAINYGFLRWFIATPQFHHWHHSVDPDAYDKNFSPHLVIFDRLFGTFHLPEDRGLPQAYGVDEEVPEGFWPQLAHPFMAADGGSAPADRGEAGWQKPFA